eukprot:TRINITY_DN13647_c0_g1_i7.p1 TRINITY_DN13647_c0_g1~~TRINITY_DN13647_c0_g1_i7.p1  ORF type:complete len:132 (+),score=27.76 TRINITY_DN13647_c0_g1_i7:59-454(+)
MSTEEFKGKVGKALEEVRRILEVERCPLVPGEVEHTYEDKYLLAELLVRTALAAQGNALEAVGMTEEAMQTLGRAAREEKKAVTIRFQANLSCTFLSSQQKTTEQRSHTQTTSLMSIQEITKKTTTVGSKY